MIEAFKDFFYFLGIVCLYLIFFTNFFEDLGDAIASRIKHGPIPREYEEKSEEDE